MMLRLHSCLGSALARFTTPACLPSLAAATPWRAYSTAPVDELDRLVDAIVDAASQRRRDADAKAIDVARIVDAVLAPAMHPVTSQPIKRLDYMFLEPEVESSVPPHLQMLLRAALVGAPNAGKSTLLNTLVGCKVSAVSHKTNTTADTMVGAITQGITQVVLFDTPGVVTKRYTQALNKTTHRPCRPQPPHRHYINHKHSTRVRSAWGIASQSDLLVFVVDAARQVCTPDPRVLRLVTNIATLGSGAKKRSALQALAPPSMDTTAVGVGSLDQGGTAAGAALSEEGMVDAVEGALQQALGVGGGVDRQQLQDALHAFFQASEDAEEDRDEDAEEDADEDLVQVSPTDGSDGSGIVSHANPGASSPTVQPGSTRLPKMGLKSLRQLDALSDVEGGQQLTDLLQQRRDAMVAAKPPQTGTLAQAVCPPCILVMNKMDMLSRREKLLALRWAMRMTELHNFDDVFYISAEKNKGMRELREYLLSRAVRGEWMLGQGQATDANPAELVQELVREKIYTYLHKELPYTTKVTHIKWEFKEGGSAYCEQHVLVRNQRQRSMVIGTKGAVIDRITTAARIEAEKVLGIPIQLLLSVKVLDKHLHEEQYAQRMGGSRRW